MAIARGAGTEIIRCHAFENVGTTTQKMIIGEQHHIYTVLSITFYCTSRSGTEKGALALYTFDSAAIGDTSTNQRINIAQINCAANETYVFNDKFSFNGYEPVDWGSNALDNATEQDAIADQGSGIKTNLRFDTDSNSTRYDITITFIDQNNA